MLGQLEALEEYNNAGALLGLDGDDDELMGDLLGQLRRLNPITRKRVINKLTAPAPPSKGSRAEMEKHFRELPPHIQEGLRRGDLRLADTVIYSIKPANSKTIKLFETQDDKEIGIRNVSNAKLPKNQAIIVSGIVLLAGVPVDGTKEAMMAAEFKEIEAVPALANGEFSLKANKKIIVPETNNYVFKTKAFTGTTLGYYKLANPRLIHDDVLIEMTLELGTLTGIPANTHVFMGIHGTITTP